MCSSASSGLKDVAGAIRGHEYIRRLSLVSEVEFFLPTVPCDRWPRFSGVTWLAEDSHSYEGTITITFILLPRRKSWLNTIFRRDFLNQPKEKSC